jgi:hypothetical protein
VTTTPSFGPTTPPRYERLPIEIRYLRDEVVESQSFNLLNKNMDMAIANVALVMTRIAPEQSLPTIIRMIGKHMDNTDGVPFNWEPAKVPPTKAHPDVERFKGPDGKFYPMDQKDQFLAPELGSSRRRWYHLMDEDDGASIDMETIVGLMQHVIEIAAGRPTPASS